MYAVIVVVQSEFTIHDPVMVSLAKLPATFLASVPEMFPAGSTLSLPTAAPGTGPIGAEKKIVPVRVNTHSLVALAFEQCSAACTGTTPRQRAVTEIRSDVRAMLRF